MNKYIKDIILDYVTLYGFVYKKNVFLRVKNDVVQGFTLRSKKAGIDTIFELYFSTFPLCNPDANFYKYCFEVSDFGILRGPGGYWPYSFVTDTKEGLAECSQKIVSHIRAILLPYFNKYDCCIAAHHKDFPELIGFKGAITDAVFYALKAKDRNAAITGLQGMLNQRQEARKQNVEHFGNTYNIPSDSIHKEFDIRDTTLIKFIQKSSDEELNAYLLANEKKALEFLRPTMNLTQSKKAR